ncbi:MAG TPA: DoxX family protein [Thermomicrobiales bacterium]|nr:DoxX family protein [Thermomicrobiales bacterium]
MALTRTFRSVGPDDETDSQRESAKRAMVAGNVIIGFVVLFMLVDGIMKVLQFDVSVEGTLEFGYPRSFVAWIGLTLVICTLLYAIPRTAFLGAILLTAYLGGATAIQLRIEQSDFIFAVFFGVLVWVGLSLRDARLRPLIFR